MGITEQVTELAVTMAEECNSIRLWTGKSSDLDTTAKTSIVAAINELCALIGAGGGGGGAVIDDGTPRPDRVWSSQKTSTTIDSRIGSALSSLSVATIDDNTITTNKVWSSSMTSNTIDSRITAAINAMPDYALIDDTTTGTANVWSSQKVQQEINTAISELPPIYELNDNQVSASKLWSSLKTMDHVAVQVGSITKASIGLSNVENKSSATIRGELTKANIDAAQGYSSLDALEKGAANGIAPLGADGRVPAGYLPASIDDVVEYANFAALPATGIGGVIYITVDDNKQYRWSGSVYTALTASPGTTDNVPEGTTNKYFQESRVRVTPLTGFSATIGAVVAADTVLQAMGKLQGQINGLSMSGATINDGVTSTTQVWSSQKTRDEIDDAIAALPTPLEMDDAAVSSSKVWSSQKINNTINAGVASVTKASLGLGNVDNTSDANKPVSTAQAAADNAILAQAYAYTNTAVTGLWDDRGAYDASGNTFPASGGSGNSGAILKGDIWTISVGGTLGGTIVAANQTVRALADAPGQTAGNWSISASGVSTVEDQIVDGVTSKAPSQNAVYDALALKQSVANLANDVRAVVLTGVSFASGAAITASDSVLSAFGKLQKQITDLAASAITATGVATLTNKTLTDATITGYTESGSNAAAGGNVTVPALSTGTDHAVTLNADGTITLPAPATGKSFTLEVNYTGNFTPTFAVTGGSAVRWPGGTAPTPTKVNGKLDMYGFKANRAGTAWIGSDMGRNH